MKLNELVPPLELCRKIPAGEFGFCSLLWIYTKEAWEEKATWKVIPKVALPSRKNVYAAPTLQEIIVEIDNLGGWCPTAYRLQNSWTVDYQEDNEDGLNDVVEQSDLDNPATAALKLWLKLKGIEQ